MTEDEVRVAAGPMAKAWREASIDLGIRFLSPFWLETTHEKKFLFSGLLPDFGSSRGALICSRIDPISDDALDTSDELGFFASGLNPEYYETFEKSRFMETLNDWGWFGNPKRSPSWFRGLMGRHGGSK